MGTFIDDFLLNLKNNVTAKQGSVPANISSGYAAYVAMTNAAINSLGHQSYAGKLANYGDSALN